MGERSSFSAFGDAISSLPAIVIYAMGCNFHLFVRQFIDWNDFCPLIG